MWLQVYVRSVDDSFTYFDSVEQCDTFVHHLNNLQPALKYTCEHEHDNKLAFLDVQVEKSNNSVVTSVYRKPTFTGQYIVYDSYCSHQYKVNLVRNLVGRAKRLCSETKLDDELEFLRSIFLKNGYPHDLLNKILQQESNNKDTFTGPRKCPIYLSLHFQEPFQVKLFATGEKERGLLFSSNISSQTNMRTCAATRRVRSHHSSKPTHHISH